MREQRGLWIELSEELRLEWGCTKDQCCHIVFLQLWQMLALNRQDGV